MAFDAIVVCEEGNPIFCCCLDLTYKLICVVKATSAMLHGTSTYYSIGPIGWFLNIFQDIFDLLL